MANRNITVYNQKVWQEWMGYTVMYVNYYNEGPYIETQTEYGVRYDRALRIMRDILKSGRAAWISKIDPENVEEIPF